MSSTTTTPALASKKQSQSKARKGKTAPVVETEPVKVAVEEKDDSLNELINEPVEIETNPVLNLATNEPSDDEIDEVEELRKKLADAEARKREKEIKKDIINLRAEHALYIQKQQKEIDERIKRLTEERDALQLEINATEDGDNDDLLIKLALSKLSKAPAIKKVSCASVSGEPKPKRQIARPELYEICDKPTTFKCVWAKGVEYLGTYDPAKRVLTWDGNEFKNLNDWVNGKEKVDGNSIADQRKQKTSAKSAWKVCFVLNSKNEWIFCDTLEKGCDRVN